MLRIDILAQEDVAKNILDYLMKFFTEEPTCVYGGCDSDVVDKKGVVLTALHVLFED